MTIFESIAVYSPHREHPHHFSFGAPYQTLLEPLLPIATVLEIGVGDREWKAVLGAEVVGLVVRQVAAVVEFARSHPGQFQFVCDIQKYPLLHRLKTLDTLLPVLAPKGVWVLEGVTEEEAAVCKGRGGTVVDRRAFNPLANNILVFWKV